MKKLIKQLIRYFIIRSYGVELVNTYGVNTLYPFWFYQRLMRINSHVSWPVHRTSQIKAVRNLKRGTRCPGMSMGCYLDARNGIVLGNNVYIGPRVSIISMNHDVNNYTQYIKEDPIIIGDNCWIGTNAIILPGVELGNHVVVGAGAVVTKSFKDNNLIIAGNPASVIKKLPDYNE